MCHLDAWLCVRQGRALRAVRSVPLVARRGATACLGAEAPAVGTACRYGRASEDGGGPVGWPGAFRTAATGSGLHLGRNPPGAISDRHGDATASAAISESSPARV